MYQEDNLISIFKMRFQYKNTMYLQVNQKSLRYFLMINQSIYSHYYQINVDYLKHILNLELNHSLLNLEFY